MITQQTPDVSGGLLALSWHCFMFTTSKKRNLETIETNRTFGLICFGNGTKRQLGLFPYSAKKNIASRLSG